MADLYYFGARNQGGAGAAATVGTLSYYENMPLLFPGSTTINVSQSSIHMLPFILPEGGSFSVLRVPVSMSAVTTEVAGTSVNTTFSMHRMQTMAAVVYTQGTGASSLSLQSIFSAGGLFTFQSVWQAAAVGSQFSVSVNVTFPAANFGTQSTDTYSYGASTSAYNLSSAGLTRLTGPRFVDIPFATSLSAGNYWIGFGRSTSFSSNAGPANLSNASIGFSTIGVSQSNISWGYPGVTTNDSIQVQPGLGWFTTNSAIFTTDSVGLAQVSAVVSNPKMYFQLIRRA